MITIVLYGDLEDKKITKLLISKLEGLYNIIYQTPYKITCYRVQNITQEILIVETDSIRFIETKNTILIFKNNINKSIDLSIENNIYIIVFSQNNKAIKFLHNSQLPNIITYGYRATDSLTSSSFNDNQKTICLQRQVKSIIDKIIEPFEFTITESNDILDLLPVYGVEILLNCRN